MSYLDGKRDSERQAAGLTFAQNHQRKGTESKESAGEQLNGRPRQHLSWQSRRSRMWKPDDVE